MLVLALTMQCSDMLAFANECKQILEKVTVNKQIEDEAKKELNDTTDLADLQEEDDEIPIDDIDDSSEDTDIINEDSTDDLEDIDYIEPINFNEELEVYSSDFRLGNSSKNIISGGMSLEFDNDYIVVEDDEMVFYQYDKETNESIPREILRDNNIKNINIIGSIIYYTSNNIIKVYDLNTLEISVVDNLSSYNVEMMYIVNEQYIYFMCNGNIYIYDIEEETVSYNESCYNAEGFIPTEYGNIFIIKSGNDYCISVKGSILITNIEKYIYTDVKYLYFYQEATTQDNDEDIQEDDLYNNEDESDNVNEGIILDINDENDNYETPLDSNIIRKNIELEELFNNFSNDSIKDNIEEEENNNTRDISSGVQNFLDRAWLIYNNRWTPRRRLHSKAFSGGFTLPQGVTRGGGPYAQPWKVNGYVGHNISLNQFNNIANNSNSKLYTTLAPENGGFYYGLDCSGYATYCWSIGRMTCSSIAQSSLFEKKGTLNVNKLKVGDAFNRSKNGHIILIVGIDSNNIYTLEQTVPETKYKKVPKNKVISQFYNNGYRVVRYKYINNVKPVDSNDGGHGNSSSQFSTHNIPKPKRNNDIASFQSWLNSKYGFNISIDGIYGKETKTGIIRGWQKQMNSVFGSGLDVDGIFGPDSYIATKKCNYLLKNGDKTAFTKMVQGMLRFRFKYKINSIDGIYNSETAKMLKKFQTSHGLVATGNINADTCYAIFNDGRNYISSCNSDPTTKNKIKILQKWLNKKYIGIFGYKLSIDGEYGPKTKKAIIMTWQWSMNKFYNTNLEVDGIFGKNSTVAAKKVVLRGGESNRFVVICKGLLNVAGIYTNYGKYYDSEGINNLKVFQKSRNLTIDGICGPKTWYMLFRQ